MKYSIGMNPNSRNGFKKGNKLGAERFGKNHPCWKGGEHIHKGYIRVTTHNHPFAKRNRIFKHRLIMEKHLGRYILPGEVIHHINGNKLDNRIKNLKIYKNNSLHMKNH